MIYQEMAYLERMAHTIKMKLVIIIFNGKYVHMLNQLLTIIQHIGQSMRVVLKNLLPSLFVIFLRVMYNESDEAKTEKGKNLREGVFRIGELEEDH